MSELIQSLYLDLEELTSDNLISKKTLKDFESKHLTYHGEINGESIRKFREMNNISQAVLARYLNLSTVSVQRWEQGRAKPTGSALVLLNLLQAKGLETLM